MKTPKNSVQAHRLLIIGVLTTTLSLQAAPQKDPESDQATNQTPTLQVPVVNEAPEVDGKLDDSAWEEAALATDFWISEQQRPPTEPTNVRVLATGNALYVGFECPDSQPEAIYSKELTHDSSLGFDDHVILELDPFHDHRTISQFMVNAIGTQRHIAAGGRGRKLEWKGNWDAATQRTPTGWTAEIRIPFKMLNFDKKSETMGINFLRYHNRTHELSRWADVTPQVKQEKMGELTGLDLSKAEELDEKTKTWTIMPYVLAGVNITDKEGDLQDTLITSGVDIRWEPRKDVTGVLSLNPDFSQIEQQITDIDFDYNEKKLPELRTFFLEGESYFEEDVRYFYSVRVPDFHAGAKMFSHLGSVKSGLLTTWAPNGRFDMVAHSNIDLSETHSLEGSAVATARDAFDNQLATAGAEGRFSSGFIYEARVAKSATQGLDGGDGHQAETDLGWQWDYWKVNAKVDEYDREFFSANGLVDADVIGTQGISGTVNYSRDFGEGAIREITGLVTWQGRHTDTDRIQRRRWYLGGTIETDKQLKFGLYRYMADYRPVDVTQRDGFSNQVNQDRFWTATLDGHTRSSKYSWGTGTSWGKLGGEDYSFSYVYGWAKPTEQLFFSVNAQYLDNFITSQQIVFSTGWDFDAEQNVVFQYINNDQGNSYRLAYQRRVREGMDIFAVFDKRPERDSSFSVKLVWTF